MSFKGTSKKPLWPLVFVVYYLCYCIGTRNKVMSVCFSPTGRKLVSGGEDSMLWIWNMKAKRTEVSRLNIHFSKKELGLNYTHIRNGRPRNGPSPALAKDAVAHSFGTCEGCLINVS